jgi:hypothetical protein
MTKTSTHPNFSGPYREMLAELASLIDWLWSEHDKSFVKAGDDKVYAFGGQGYVIVLDESQWKGLIEFMTPEGAFTIKPDDEGKTNVTSTIQDEKAAKQAFKEGIEAIKNYYETRYWRTPRTS